MTHIVLNIRPGSDADQDAATLRRRGVAAMAAPVLAITPLPAEIPPATHCSGLIFTSRHAIDAFCAILGTDSAAPGWAALPVFVVGQATAARARQVGFDTVITGAGGGAGLVPLIRDMMAPDALPLLWPAAADKSFDLVAALQPHAITVTPRTVYCAGKEQALPPAVCTAIAAGQVCAVLSMSARTSQAFVELLQAHDLWHHRAAITLIAGSDGIAAAAGDGWQKIYVARAPKRTRLLAIAVLVYRAVKSANRAGAQE